MIVGITDSFQKIVRSGLVLDLDPGLSRSYPGSGAIWTDVSGFGNHVTFTNAFGNIAPTFSSSNGGHINLDSNPLILGSGTLSTSLKPNNITMEAWANTGSSKAVNRGIITVQRGSGETLNYGLKLIDGKYGVFIFANAAIATSGNEFNPILQLNTWVHVLGTWDGTTLKMYVDGIQRSSSTETSGNLSYDSLNTRFVIGSQYKGTVMGGTYNTGPDGYWSKPIGPVRIYNRALTAAEVLQNFNVQRLRFNV